MESRTIETGYANDQTPVSPGVKHTEITMVMISSLLTPEAGRDWPRLNRTVRVKLCV